MAGEDGQEAELRWYSGLDQDLSSDGDILALDWNRKGTESGVEVADKSPPRSIGRPASDVADADIKPVLDADDADIDERFPDVDIAAPAMSTSCSDTKEMELYDKRLNEAFTAVKRPRVDLPWETPSMAWIFGNPFGLRNT